MRILKNYIVQEWFSLFLLALLIVSFVLVVGNIVKLVEMVVAKGVAPGDVFKLFLYLLPSLLVFSIPISMLTATLLSVGRMAYDNEITAIRSSGISLYPLFFTLLLIGLLFGFICLYFNDTLIPESHYNTRKLLKDIGVKKPTTYLEEKTFIKAFKNHIIFIYKINEDKLEDVRIYQPQGDDKPTRTIVSEWGEFISIPDKGAIKLALKHGVADEPSFENPEVFYKVRFSTYYLTLYLDQAVESGKGLDKKVSDMTINELRLEINKMKRMQIDARPLLVGLYEKFSLSVSGLLFILIGVPLALRVRRRERSLGFGISIIICLAYYFLMALGEGLALRNKITPFAGVWLANFALLFIGIFLTIKILEE